jgi:putative flavoprotein involved in K+ transport
MTLDARLDTVIVGGGQAGLALGYHLRRAGRRFAVVEAADRLGDSWRRRWDSLTLFTPRRYDALPGQPFPGNPEGYPGKDEVADYLEGYARRWDLPVLLGTRVSSVRRDSGHGSTSGFTVEADGSTLQARQVVVASGGFAGPVVPGFAQRLDERIVQLHSSSYRNPASVPEGRVLVVGAGNTGVQIAEELAEAGRQVALSVSTLGKALPNRLLGKSLFWWIELLHGMDAGPDTRIGRRLKNDNNTMGTDLEQLFRRVERLPRAVDADRGGVLSSAGERYRPDAVIWATGYRPSYPWLHVPVLDERGAPIQYHGITDIPGLAFLGLPWQRSRGSALLGWVGRDAAVLADRLGDQLPPVHRAGARASMPVSDHSPVAVGA